MLAAAFLFNLDRRLPGRRHRRARGAHPRHPRARPRERHPGRRVPHRHDPGRRPAAVDLRAHRLGHDVRLHGGVCWRSPILPVLLLARAAAARTSRAAPVAGRGRARLGASACACPAWEPSSR
ncbi:MAG: hypothetical protein MZV49_06055 [Rhodopseudomonas palustris]|nr:hypothetical protein [Rhodopseudomonas palustris]